MISIAPLHASRTQVSPLLESQPLALVSHERNKKSMSEDSSHSMVSMMLSKEEKDKGLRLKIEKSTLCHDLSYSKSAQ